MQFTIPMMTMVLALAATAWFNETSLVVFLQQACGYLLMVFDRRFERYRHNRDDDCNQIAQHGMRLLECPMKSPGMEPDQKLSLRISILARLSLAIWVSTYLALHHDGWQWPPDAYHHAGEALLVLSPSHQRWMNEPLISFHCTFTHWETHWQCNLAWRIPLLKKYCIWPYDLFFGEILQ